MPTAVLMLRDRPPWPRSEIYRDGLERLGYSVEIANWNLPGRHKPEPDDVLVIWNRFGVRDTEAAKFERAGANVIVTENGWIRPDDRKYYAMCLGHHNGVGSWHIGQEDRFSGFGVHVRPWRESGEHILVLPSRGIGRPGVAMPPSWARTIVQRLQQVTKRPIKVRPHPGQNHSPLEPDLKNCHAVVTWASGAAVKALAYGVPVFYELKGWIGSQAAKRGIEDLESPFIADRMPMFRRLAWAQWTADEIASGEPFAWLLT